MNRGYTLVEVLSVIVVISILSLIGIPAVSKSIEKVKVESVKNSAQNIIDATKQSSAAGKINIVNNTVTFECNGDKCYNDSNYALNLDGKVPSSGYVVVDSTTTEVIDMQFGDYCVSGTKGNISVEKRKCSLAVGIYDKDYKLIATWDKLVSQYKLDVEQDYGDQPTKVVNGKKSMMKVIMDNSILSNAAVIIMPKGIKKIGSGAMAAIGYEEFGCAHGSSGTGKILEIKLPIDLEYIGDEAFSYNTKLKEITLPVSVREMGYAAFSSCRSLKTFVIPKNVTKIANALLEDCSKLTKINIPYSITEIGYHAFKGCSALKEIEIPDGIKIINSSTFEECYNLKTLKLPSKLEEIDSFAFQGCSKLNGITIPKTIKKIDVTSFKDCESLTNLKIEENNIYSDGNMNMIIDKRTQTIIRGSISEVIPASVKVIDSESYKGIQIKKITIPSNVVKIEGSAFYDYSWKIDSITFENTTGWKFVDKSNGKIKDIDFSDSTNNAKLLNKTWNYGYFYRD